MRVDMLWVSPLF